MPWFKFLTHHIFIKYWFEVKPPFSEHHQFKVLTLADLHLNLVVLLLLQLQMLISHMLVLMIVLILYTLTPACIFFILFCVHILACWQGYFVWQSRPYFMDINFLYSCDLTEQSRCNVIGRNWMLVTMGSKSYALWAKLLLGSVTSYNNLWCLH